MVEKIKEEIFQVVPRHYIRSVERFLVTGPCVFGWIIGILRYRFHDKVFRVSVQNMLITISFFIVYLIIYALDLLFDMGNYLYYIHSFISLCYITLNLVIYYFIWEKEKILIHHKLISFLDRVLNNNSKVI